MARRIFVTGGLGFIGTNFVKVLLESRPDVERVIIADYETYAAQPYWKEQEDARVQKVLLDIRDQAMVSRVFQLYRPDTVFHFAAESHVCRSIAGPKDFMTTNIVGTWNLLEEWRLLHQSNQSKKFIHVSTDEVFGELGPNDPPFNEETPLSPRSPYASSKASSDLIAFSYFHTYGLPVLVTNCTNNFGKHQHEEKLIPATARRLYEGQPAVVFGSGDQVRDWIYVDDHCRALLAVETWGKPGERYCIGGECEIKNKDLVTMIHGALQEIGLHVPDLSIRHDYEARPTDDRRYAIDNTKIRGLGWAPRAEDFKKRLERTLQWYAKKWISKI